MLGVVRCRDLYGPGDVTILRLLYMFFSNSLFALFHFLRSGDSAAQGDE